MAYNQINLDSAVAVPGMPVVPNQAIYTPVNYLAENAVPVGQFVAKGTADGTAAAAGITTAGDIIGFNERVINSFNYDLTSAGSLSVPDGGNLTIAVKGFYYVSAPDTVTEDAFVYCDATGAICASSATGAIKTKWLYYTAGDAGDIVIITNLS